MTPEDRQTLRYLAQSLNAMSQALSTLTAQIADSTRALILMKDATKDDE